MSLLDELKELYPELTAEQLETFRDSTQTKKEYFAGVVEKKDENFCDYERFSGGDRDSGSSSNDDSDDEEQDFENFVEKMKTPIVPKSVPCSAREMKKFVVNDDDSESDVESSSPTFYYKSLQQRVSYRFNVPSQNLFRRPLKEFNSKSEIDENGHRDSRYSNTTPPSVLTFVPKGTPKFVKRNGRMKTFSTSNTNELNVDAKFAAAVDFLNSLSSENGNSDPSSSVSQFRKTRNALVSKLFKIFNKYVFDNQLPLDLEISWNVRMTATAGYCYYKKGLHPQRQSRIELSTKVCDSAERVRDTLIHELCHAAVWLLNGEKSNHGRLWKRWARKAELKFPCLEPITRCHSYNVATKFTYRCTKCKYEIHRHSKSLDTNAKVCGYCTSSFELVVNKNKSKLTKDDTTQTPKFALFVQANYSSVKKENNYSNHKEIMRLLGEKFKGQLHFDD